jgi:hypothetical protein
VQPFYRAAESEKEWMRLKNAPAENDGINIFKYQNRGGAVELHLSIPLATDGNRIPAAVKKGSGRT